jgi:hypothetical protein
MRIDHRRLHIVVAQQLLHRPDIVALLQQMRRKTVPKGMAAGAFGKPCRTPCSAHSLLQAILTGVMAADDSRPRVFRQTVGWKDVWPDPEPAGLRILACQRQRSGDRGYPLRDILRLSSLDVREMCLERADQAFGQRGAPLLQAFAIAHDDLTLGNVQVFDAQSQTFHQP